MRERSFQIEFGKWVKANMKQSAAFELKSTKTGSFPFSDLKEHQELALWHAKHGKIYHKIPDVGYQNPFDCLLLVEVPAYVVIRYGSGHWYAIDIDRFIEGREMTLPVRKSLLEDVARTVCAFSDELSPMTNSS